jgi:hypothetical protein
VESTKGEYAVVLATQHEEQMASIGSRPITLKIPLNWLWGILILAASLIVAFIFVPDKVRPILVFGAAVVAGAGALITAANNVDQRSAAAAKADEMAAYERIVAAMGFIDKWTTPMFYHCKTKGREVIDYFDEHPRVDEQMAWIEANPAHRANLIDLLNHFEYLSIGIAKNIVDDVTAREFFRSIAIKYWHAAESYIKKRRADRGNDRLFKEYEVLYERWKH